MKPKWFKNKFFEKFIQKLIDFFKLDISLKIQDEIVKKNKKKKLVIYILILFFNLINILLMINLRSNYFLKIENINKIKILNSTNYKNSTNELNYVSNNSLLNNSDLSKINTTISTTLFEIDFEINKITSILYFSAFDLFLKIFCILFLLIIQKFLKQKANSNKNSVIEKSNNLPNSSIKDNINEIELSKNLTQKDLLSIKINRKQASKIIPFDSNYLINQNSAKKTNKKVKECFSKIISIFLSKDLILQFIILDLLVNKLKNLDIMDKKYFFNDYFLLFFSNILYSINFYNDCKINLLGKIISLSIILIFNISSDHSILFSNLELISIIFLLFFLEKFIYKLNSNLFLMEKKIQTKINHYNTFLDNYAIGILILDKNFNLKANNKFFDMMNLPIKENIKINKIFVSNDLNGNSSFIHNNNFKNEQQNQQNILINKFNSIENKNLNGDFQNNISMYKDNKNKNNSFFIRESDKYDFLNNQSNEDYETFEFLATLFYEFNQINIFLTPILIKSYKELYEEISNHKKIKKEYESKTSKFISNNIISNLLENQNSKSHQIDLSIKSYNKLNRNEDHQLGKIQHSIFLSNNNSNKYFDQYKDKNNISSSVKRNFIDLRNDQSIINNQNEKINKYKFSNFNADINELKFNISSIEEKEQLIKNLKKSTNNLIERLKKFIKILISSLDKKELIWIANKKFRNNQNEKKHLRIYAKINWIKKSQIEFLIFDLTDIYKTEKIKVQNKIKNIFLNKFSHEFRNPLLNIIQLCDNLNSFNINKNIFYKNIGTKLQNINSFNTNNNEISQNTEKHNTDNFNNKITIDNTNNNNKILNSANLQNSFIIDSCNNNTENILLSDIHKLNFKENLTSLNSNTMNLNNEKNILSLNYENSEIRILLIHIKNLCKFMLFIITDFENLSKINFLEIKKNDIKKIRKNSIIRDNIDSSKSNNFSKNEFNSFIKFFDNNITSNDNLNLFVKRKSTEEIPEINRISSVKRISSRKNSHRRNKNYIKTFSNNFDDECIQESKSHYIYEDNISNKIRGSEQLEEVQFCFPKILNKMVKIFKTKINLSGKNISIITEVSEGFPKIIKLDLNKINQILFNLLSNSFKFTNIGTIKINLTFQNKELIININDSGSGIKQDILNKIGQPFLKDSSATNNLYGMGMGLFMVKDYVEKLEGKLLIESECGEGTRISISFYYNREEIDKSIENTFQKIEQKMKKFKTQNEKNYYEINIMNNINNDIYTFNNDILKNKTTPNYYKLNKDLNSKSFKSLKSNNENQSLKTYVNFENSDNPSNEKIIFSQSNCLSELMDINDKNNILSMKTKFFFKEDKYLEDKQDINFKNSNNSKNRFHDIYRRTNHKILSILYNSGNVNSHSNEKNLSPILKITRMKERKNTKKSHLSKFHKVYSQTSENSLSSIDSIENFSKDNVDLNIDDSDNNNEKEFIKNEDFDYKDESKLSSKKININNQVINKQSTISLNNKIKKVMNANTEKNEIKKYSEDCTVLNEDMNFNFNYNLYNIESNNSTIGDLKLSYENYIHYSNLLDKLNVVSNSNLNRDLKINFNKNGLNDDSFNSDGVICYKNKMRNSMIIKKKLKTREEKGLKYSLKKFLEENSNSQIKQSVLKTNEINKNEDVLNLKVNNFFLTINPSHQEISNRLVHSNLDYKRKSDGKILRILLVDDEKLIRQSEINIIRKYFIPKKIEFEIEECSDGIECLYKLYLGTINGIKYDLILTDETMNFMKGSSMAKIIKSLAKENLIKDIKIFMITSYEAETLSKKYFDVIDKVLTKPLTYQMLEAILNLVLFE